MIAAVLRRGAHGTAYLCHQLAPVEEGDMLRPWDRHQDPDAVLGGPVEQPARRNGERAQAVRPDLDHEAEITLERLLLREREPVRRRGERPVRDAPEVELVVTDEEELAADGGGPAVERGQGCPLRQRAEHGLRHTWRNLGNINDGARRHNRARPTSRTGQATNRGAYRDAAAAVGARHARANRTTDAIQAATSASRTRRSIALLATHMPRRDRWRNRSAERQAGGAATAAKRLPPRRDGSSTSGVGGSHPLSAASRLGY